MMQPDDLLSLKDDMIAFIEGHGMRRLPGYVGDDVPTVMWEDDANPDSWKDFVETAKAAAAPFVTMSDVVSKKKISNCSSQSCRISTFPTKKAPRSKKPNPS